MDKEDGCQLKVAEKGTKGLKLGPSAPTDKQCNYVHNIDLSIFSLIKIINHKEIGLNDIEKKTKENLLSYTNSS